jgi:hypothetical protein
MSGGPCAEWCGKKIVFNLKDSSDSVSGEVYTYERCSDTLVICENRVGSNLATYRFLKSSSIDMSTLQISGEHVPPEILPVVPPSTIARIREREEAAVQREMAKASMIASGVSREAQLLFNGLAKTMRYYILMLLSLALDKRITFIGG